MDMIYLSAALIIAISAISGAFGISFLGSKLLESTARQPELGPSLQTKFFIVGGMIEAIPIIGVGIAMFLIFVKAA